MVKTYNKVNVLLHGLFVLMAAVVLFICGTTVDAQCDVYDGNNIGTQNYKVGTTTTKSALVVVPDGYMRFQANAMDSAYLVEYYDTDYSFLRKTVVPAELPIFGAFYDDGSYYYVVSGQKNMEERDYAEVYRVTKYDRSWRRISHASLCGANTTIPFNAATARVDHYGNYLFIHSCHQLYQTKSTGVYHQSNMTFVVNTSTMTIADSQYLVKGSPYGYVSHSFNQFVAIDDGYFVAVDHGDAYPRSVVLTKSKKEFGSTDFSKSNSTAVNLLNIGGEYSNSTGVSVGGFEVSSSSYITVGNTVDMANYDPNATRNLFVSVVPRDLSSDPVIKMITCYGNGENSPSTPHLVKLSSDSFLMLWEYNQTVQYCFLDGYGNVNGEVYSLEGRLSDCVPVVTNNKVVWYTWRKEIITFCSISLEDPEEVETVVWADGHDYDCTEPTDTDFVVTVTCKNCGHQESFTTMSKFSMWWGLNTPYSYSSLIRTTVAEGDTLYYSLNKTTPAEVQNKELVITTSDPTIAQIESAFDNAYGKNAIHFLRAGTVTLTLAAKYNPNAKLEYTITVNHIPEGEGELICEPTCADTGVMTYWCTFCNDFYYVDIPTVEHVFEIEEAKEGTYVATRTCVECDLQEEVTTLESFKVYWRKNVSSGSFSSNCAKTLDCGDYLEFLLSSKLPATADVSDVLIKVSDENIAKIENRRITFVADGTVTITFYAKYNPYVKREYTITVSHAYEISEEKAAADHANGYTEYSCTRCGHTYRRTIPALLGSSEAELTIDVFTTDGQATVTGNWEYYFASDKTVVDHGFVIIPTELIGAGDALTTETPGRNVIHAENFNNEGKILFSAAATEGGQLTICAYLVVVNADNTTETIYSEKATF